MKHDSQLPGTPGAIRFSRKRAMALAALGLAGLALAGVRVLPALAATAAGQRPPAAQNAAAKQEQPDRLTRLEQEVAGLCEELRSLRELLERGDASPAARNDTGVRPPEPAAAEPSGLPAVPRQPRELTRPAKSNAQGVSDPNSIPTRMRTRFGPLQEMIPPNAVPEPNSIPTGMRPQFGTELVPMAETPDQAFLRAAGDLNGTTLDLSEKELSAQSRAVLDRLVTAGKSKMRLTIYYVLPEGQAHALHQFLAAMLPDAEEQQFSRSQGRVRVTTIPAVHLSVARLLQTLREARDNSTE
jgi:hypothetical protein